VRFFLSRFFICAILIFSTSSYAKDEDDFTLAVAKTVSFVNQQQVDIWPGFSISTIPSIVHFGGQHIYGYNFNPKHPHWEKRIIDTEAVYYLDQDEIGIGNISLSFDFVVDDQHSYVYGYLSDDACTDVRGNIFRFAHERFHLYQDEKFPSSTFPFESYDGFNQIENVQLAYLEAAVMKEYLSTYSQEAIKDYIAIYQYRSRLLNNESKLYEQHKINIEGIATYVGLKSLGLNEKIRNQFLVNNYDHWCSFNKINDCILRRQYYFSGAAIGFVLDKDSDQTWKQDLEKNGICPLVHLIQKYPMSEVEINKRLKMAKIRYHFEKIEKPVEDAINTYQAEIKEKENNYQSFPGIELTTKFACPMSGTRASQKQYFINGHLSLHIGVNIQMACDNNAVTISSRNLPFLYESNQYSEKFKVDPSTRLIINDHEETIEALFKKGKSVLFHDLILENSNTIIRIKNLVGIIQLQDKSLLLKVKKA